MAIRIFRNWYLIYSKYLGIYIKKETYLYLRNGLRFLIVPSSSEWWPILEIFGFNSYGLEKIVKSGHVIIDIGANVGGFTIYAAKIARQLKIYSYEPNNDVFRRLKHNLKINNIRSLVFPHQLAVSSKIGRANLYLEEKNGRCNTTGATLGNECARPFFKQKESVKTTTLTQIIKINRLRKIDILKMDCEGSEYAIIYQTPKEIFKKIKYIIIELHFSNKNDKVIQYLKSLNFKVMPRDKLNSVYLFSNKSCL